MLKRLVVRKLQQYTRRFFAAHPDIKLVVVVGSVGKTSTKHMIATLLREKYRVRMHAGNFNTAISVPLAILDIELPARLTNVGQWLCVFRLARQRIAAPSDVEVIVQELGTDSPGDIAQFGDYLQPDIAVVTAITPEHMEFFGTLDAVAAEELSVATYAKQLLVNADDIETKYLKLLDGKAYQTYGTSSDATYAFVTDSFSAETGYQGQVLAHGAVVCGATLGLLGVHSTRAAAGAAAVASMLGVSSDEIAEGMGKLRATPGRMNMLPGLKQRIVIDDSYNSSPAAAAAALQTLYEIDAPQRVAILGDMRELGETAAREHTLLAEQCDPQRLDLVVTVGPEMKQYFAPTAEQRGCKVYVAKNAIDAAGYVDAHAVEGAAVLVKGSQNTIFLEESVKQLVTPEHHGKLVRKSDSWMQTKTTFFNL